MFSPPFCPSKKCAAHIPAAAPPGWYVKRGHHATLAFGAVPRFTCKLCGRGFSTQTFSLDYFAKKKVPYPIIEEHLVTSSGIRDISRLLSVSTGTVQNRLSRLSRQAIAVHSTLLSTISLCEDLVADGFESFTVSQYFPNNITILVGKKSQYLYHLNYTTIRRKGRMTEEQKIQRAQLERHYTADPRGIGRCFSRILDVLCDLHERSGRNLLVLFTDEKHEYRRALAAHRSAHRLMGENKLTHTRIPSTAPRTTTNHLFAVNYMDRQFRKDLANHVRETVKFALNVNDCMDRLKIYQMRHNYKKIFRVKRERRDTRVHAQMAGATQERITAVFSELYTRRRFLSHLSLCEDDLRVWRRHEVTPLKTKGEYLPKFALN